jgi:hypothetical protein
MDDEDEEITKDENDEGENGSEEDGTFCLTEYWS